MALSGPLSKNNLRNYYFPGRQQKLLSPGPKSLPKIYPSVLLQ